MTEFVASNGVTVRPDDGGVTYRLQDGMDVFVGPSGLAALREFFLAERDAELGRWRSKEHPEYVVYPNPDGTVYVVDESRPGGENEWIRRGQWVGESAYYPARQVANEFFAAHPVSKPWHDAKPGEVWVIEAADWGTKACIVDADWGTKACIVDVDYFTWAEHALPVTSEQITAGRRIWPEGGDA